MSERERRYRAIVEQAAVGVVAADLEGRIVEANEAFSRMFGYGPEEVRSLRVREITHPADVEASGRRFRELVAGTRGSYRLEKRYLRKDGSVFWGRVNASLVRDESGAPELAVATIEDIDDRKRAEERLRDAERRYRMLVEQLPLVTYVDALDDRSSNIYTSPQLEPILGYTVEQWQSDPELFVRILHPDDRDRVLERIHATNESGARFASEYRLIARDGRVVWFHDESVVVRDGDGNPLYSQGYLLDITERKVAQRALLRREAVLEAVGRISEELLRAESWEDVDVVRPLGLASEASRAYLLENRVAADGSLRTTQRREWVAPGMPLPEDDPLRAEVDFRALGLARWADTLSSGGVIRGKVGDFPRGETDAIFRREILAILLVPVVVSGEWWGLIGVDDRLNEREWGDAEVDALRAAASVLGDAIQRQRVRDALLESEARFAAFMDNIQAVAFMKDSAGRYVYANAEWQAAFGHRPDDVLGRTDGELFAGDVEEVTEGDAETLAAGTPIQRIEHVDTVFGRGTMLTLKFPFTDQTGARYVGGVSVDVTERERADEALRETTQTLEAIVESSPLAIITFDREGVVTRWSHAAERTFGWSAEEAIGRFNPLLPEGAQEGFREMIQLALKGKSWRDVEVLRRRKDGAEIQVSASSAPLIDGSGKAVGMIAVLADVTQRKRTERRLAAQHSVARALAESGRIEEAAPLVVEAVCDDLGWDVGALLLVDRAAELLRYAAGWHRQSERPAAFADACADWTWERGEGVVGRVWASGEAAWIGDVASDDTFLRSAWADAVGVHGAFVAPIESGGEVLGVLVFFSTAVVEADEEMIRTISAVGSQIGQFVRRSEALSAVREREERFRTLVANIPGVVYRCAPNVDWTMAFISDGIRDLTGYPASEFLGDEVRTYASVIHPDDRAEVIRVVGEAVAKREPFTLEYRVVRRDESIRWVAEQGQPVIAPGGDVLWLDGAIFDVTGQKQAEDERKRAQAERELLVTRLERQNEQLRELDRMKDDFVALISHELRTPLTSILGYIELLLEGEAGNVSDEQEHFLRVIERNAQRLLRLVGDLLFVAQIEAGKLAIERTPVDLTAVVDDCLEAARPRAADKGIELRREGELAERILGDRTRLAQLLDNLVSNAIKFTPDGGKVGVKLAREKGRVRLSVRDTGLGIPKAEQEHLFQRFYRTSEATRKAIQGTGLGLTITKAIVEAHGGSIAVESEEGKGTTFVVDLPIGRSSATRDPDPAPVAVEGG